MSELDTFIEQLDASPRILLLGQRVFGIDDASNPVLRIPNLDPQDVYNACLGEQAEKRRHWLAFFNRYNICAGNHDFRDTGLAKAKHVQKQKTGNYDCSKT